jgi:hypothetical protein
MLNAQAAFCGRQDLPHFAAVTGMSNRGIQCQRLELMSGGMETNRSLSETGRAHAPAVGEYRAISGPQADAP